MSGVRCQHYVGGGTANGCPYPLSLRDISLYYSESPDVLNEFSFYFRNTHKEDHTSLWVFA